MWGSNWLHLTKRKETHPFSMAGPHIRSGLVESTSFKKIWLQLCNRHGTELKLKQDDLRNNTKNSGVRFSKVEGKIKCNVILVDVTKQGKMVRLCVRNSGIFCVDFPGAKSIMAWFYCKNFFGQKGTGS
jgi:hypothetical protein